MAKLESYNAGNDSWDGMAIPFRTVLLTLCITVIISIALSRIEPLFLLPLCMFFAWGMQYPRSLYFLLLMAIPLSAEWQVTPALGTDFPDEPIMWLLTLALPLGIISGRLHLDIHWRQPLLFLLLLSVAWIPVAMVFSDYPLLSLKFLLAKCWYIIPFCLGTVIFADGRRSLLSLGRCLAVPMLLATVVIVIRHALLGFTFDSINLVTWPFFRNHVNYSAMLVCLIPVAYALYRSDHRFRKYWLAAVLLSCLALYLTFSRGAWLALILSLAAVYAMKRRKLQWMLLLAGILISSTTGYLMKGNRYLNYSPSYEQTIYHGNFGEHLRATYMMRDLSTAERFYRWIAAVNMTKKRWLTGFGPNSFYRSYKPFAVQSFRTYVSDNPEKSTVHNYFLLLMVEQGLPGMLIFLALYVFMLIRAQKIYHATPDPFIRGLMAVIVVVVSMIGVLISLSDLMETDKIGPLFFICLGLLIRFGDAGNRQKDISTQ